MPSGDPIEGDVLVVVAAKASVPPSRVPKLVDRAQAELAPDLASLRRRYELAYETDTEVALFVDDDFWESIGDRLGLDERETDALRRAHHEQLRYRGKRLNRSEAFETALEIRDCVVVHSPQA
jgi:hypothetical protein